MPVISVVMPVYRRTEYLPTTIENILNQTFSDFELICVDGQDGGEECKSIIQNYAAKDVRVKYIVQDGVGVGDARNTGLNYAAGEYFAVHDSDDVSNPQRLQKQVDFLKDNQDYAAVVGRISRIDETGKIRSKNTNPWKDPGRSDALCYKSAALAAGGYRRFFTSGGEDTDFGCRFLEKGFVTGRINEELYHYRVYPSGQLTSNNGVMFLKHICAAYYCAYCRKVLGKDPVDEGKSVEEIAEELGGIHLPIKNALDDSIVRSRLKHWKEQSLSRYFIMRCIQKAKRHARFSGNYSDCASIIQFMENYFGTDKINRKHVQKAKLKFLSYALKHRRFRVFWECTVMR